MTEQTVERDDERDDERNDERDDEWDDERELPHSMALVSTSAIQIIGFFRRTLICSTLGRFLTDSASAALDESKTKTAKSVKHFRKHKNQLSSSFLFLFFM